MRIERLNDLGFDVDELDIVTDWDGATARIQPKVVDAGHHNRRLQGLTGLDVEENQARRLLNDLDAFAAYHDLQGEDPAMVAHRWLTEIFEPVTALAPAEPARAARGGRDVPRDPRAPLVPVRAARRGAGPIETARDYLRHPGDPSTALTELPEVATLPDSAPDRRAAGCRPARAAAGPAC